LNKKKKKKQILEIRQGGPGARVPGKRVVERGHDDFARKCGVFFRKG